MSAYRKNDFLNYDGRVMYGRIIRYDYTKGYGFIRLQDGKDLFISSYNIARKKEEAKVVVGCIVSFRIKLRGKSKCCADDVKILEQFPNGIRIDLPNRDSLRIRDITGFQYYPDKKIIRFSLKFGDYFDITQNDLPEIHIRDYYEKLDQSYFCLPSDFSESILYPMPSAFAS